MWRKQGQYHAVDVREPSCYSFGGDCVISFNLPASWYLFLPPSSSNAPQSTGCQLHNVWMVFESCTTLQVSGSRPDTDCLLLGPDSWTAAARQRGSSCDPLNSDYCHLNCAILMIRKLIILSHENHPDKKYELPAVQRLSSCGPRGLFKPGSSCSCALACPYHT